MKDVPPFRPAGDLMWSLIRVGQHLLILGYQAVVVPASRRVLRAGRQLVSPVIRGVLLIMYPVTIMAMAGAFLGFVFGLVLASIAYGLGLIPGARKLIADAGETAAFPRASPEPSAVTDASAKGSPSKTTRVGPRKSPSNKNLDSRGSPTKSLNSRSPPSKASPVKSPAAKSTEPKSPTSKFVEPKSPTSKFVEPKSPANKSVEPKSPTSTLVEPKSPKSKFVEPKSPKSKNAEPKSPKSKTADPKSPKSKTAEPKSSKSKLAESNIPTNKSPEPKSAVSRSPPSKSTSSESKGSKVPASTGPTNEHLEPRNPLGGNSTVGSSEHDVDNYWKTRRPATSETSSSLARGRSPGTPTNRSGMHLHLLTRKLPSSSPTSSEKLRIGPLGQVEAESDAQETLNDDPDSPTAPILDSQEQLVPLSSEMGSAAPSEIEEDLDSDSEGFSDSDDDIVDDRFPSVPAEEQIIEENAAGGLMTGGRAAGDTGEYVAEKLSVPADSVVDRSAKESTDSLRKKPAVHFNVRPLPTPPLRSASEADWRTTDDGTDMSSDDANYRPDDHNLPGADSDADATFIYDGTYDSANKDKNNPITASAHTEGKSTTPPQVSPSQIEFYSRYRPSQSDIAKVHTEDVCEDGYITPPRHHRSVSSTSIASTPTRSFTPPVSDTPLTRVPQNYLFGRRTSSFDRDLPLAASIAEE